MTIEKNLSKITTEQFDLDFEVDPYFHKTSSAFDEGGVKGLLLLQVRSNSDENYLRLDSNISVQDEERKVDHCYNYSEIFYRCMNVERC